MDVDETEYVDVYGWGSDDDDQGPAFDWQRGTIEYMTPAFFALALSSYETSNAAVMLSNLKGLTHASDSSSYRECRGACQGGRQWGVVIFGWYSHPCHSSRFDDLH